MAPMINSGAIEATNKLREVPEAQWFDLMQKRRSYLARNLPHDCRCLIEFVSDTDVMHDKLGFPTADEMIRNGLGLVPDDIRYAVEWLKISKPDYPIPIDVVSRLAARARAVVEQSQATQRAPGRPPKNHDNNLSDVKGFPSGNSAAAAERRLRKDRPDLHERVLAGELSWNAAMVEAGFRKPRPSRKRSTLDRIKRLLPALTEAERAELRTILSPVPPI